MLNKLMTMNELSCLFLLCRACELRQCSMFCIGMSLAADGADLSFYLQSGAVTLGIAIQTTAPYLEGALSGTLNSAQLCVLA